MIVCIDGPNFVGKTSIIEEVKVFVKDLIVIEDSEIFECAQELGSFYEARIKLQKKYNLYDRKQNVLICRWFPSMFVFDGVTDFKDLVVPDYTFVIICDLDKLLIRQGMRKHLDLKMSLSEQIEKFKQVGSVIDCHYVQNDSLRDLKTIASRIVECFDRGEKMNFTMKDLKEEFEDASVVSHYDDLGKKFGLTPAEKYIIEKYVKRDCSILEIGCGTGRICNNLYNLGYKNIFAIDLSNNMIKIAKLNAKTSNVKVKFKTMSAIKIANLGCKFDAVIFGYNGLCDIPTYKNRLRVLARISDVLNPDGIFIFSTQDRNQNLEKYGDFWKRKERLFKNGEENELGDLIRYKFNNVKTYVNVPSFDEVANLLKQSNLDLVFTDMTRNLTSDINDELGDFRMFVAKKH